MNRRSILRLLGLAPIAVPPAVAAASRPTLAPIDYSDLAASTRAHMEANARADADAKLSSRIDHVLHFDGHTMLVPKLMVGSPVG